MRGSTGFHHFSTPEETERARALVAAPADAATLVEAISTLPEGEQALCRRLLAHVASSHTSRKTKVRAMERLATETNLRPSMEAAQLAATYSSTIHVPTQIAIEASQIAGEEVAP